MAKFKNIKCEMCSDNAIAGTPEDLCKSCRKIYNEEYDAEVDFLEEQEERALKSGMSYEKIINNEHRDIYFP